MDFDSLSPEDKQAFVRMLSEMGTLDEEDAMLQEQMAMADALAPKQPRGWGTGAAAPLGAIADVFGAGVNAYKQNQLMGKRDKLLGRKRAGAEDMANKFFGAPRPSPFDFGIDEAPVMMDDGIPEFLRRR